MALFYLTNLVFSNQKATDEEKCDVHMLLPTEIETCNGININPW